MSQEIFEDSYTDSLWKITVRPYLAEPLWKRETSYNAGHFLVLPMYAAFEQNKPEWKRDFAKQFKWYSDSGVNDMGKTLLYRIQYIYLASEFINLCKQYQEDALIPPNLYEQLYQKIETTWMNDRVWNWKHPKYKKSTFKNMRAKVLWKLYNKAVTEKTYHTAILDEELFTMATAANLKRSLALSGLNKDGMLDDIVQISNEVFAKRSVYTADSGWIFQPGYWSNYEDFVYAGNPSVTDSIQKSIVPDIAEDFSHSMRYPCWINSFMNAQEVDTPYYKFYEKIKKGLTTQLYQKILVLPSDSNAQYKAVNYMDGRNGVYRYKYSGRAGGIGPFQLSGALQIGWWSFLDSERIRQMYTHIASTSNLGQVNKYYLYKAVNESTFKYLICILASKRMAVFE